MHQQLSQRYPLLIPVFALIAGIFFASKIPWIGTTFLIVSLMVLVMGIGMLYFYPIKNLRICLVALFFFGLGWIRVGDIFYIKIPGPVDQWIEQKSQQDILIESLDYCHSEGDRSRFTGNILGYFAGEQFKPFRLKVRMSLQSPTCQISPGFVFRASAKFGKPKQYNNPASFDFPRYLRGHGVLVTGYVPNPEKIMTVKFPNFFFQLTATLRQKILSNIENSISSTQVRGVLEALLVGEERWLDLQTQEDFRRCGITHVLVVSGLHLSLLLLVFYYPLYFLFSHYPPWSNGGQARKLAMVLALGPTVLYSMVVGATPSVLRSLVMAVITVFALLSQWRKHFPSILLLSLGVLLIASPLMLFDFSFQLSFLSVAAIYFLGFPFQEILQIVSERYLFLKKRMILWSLTILYSSIVVNLALFPLLANTFHEVSLMAPLANLMFVPYFAFCLLPGEIYAAVLSFFQPFWSRFIFSFLGVITEKVLYCLHLLANTSFASLLVGPLRGLSLLAFSILLLGLIQIHRPRRALIFLMIAFGIFLGKKGYHKLPPSTPLLRLIMVDVGQGDGMILSLPNGKAMVIDGGGIPYSDFDVGHNVMAPELLFRDFHEISSLMMTHPDADHFKGLMYLAEKFKVDRFLLSPNSIDHSDFSAFKKQLMAKHIPLVLLTQGEKFEEDGVNFEVLWPPLHQEDIPAIKSSSDNNHCLVLRVCYQKICFLFTGDIEREVEEYLVRGELPLQSEVLKVAHHGSSTSSTKEFLQKVNPRVALISDGKDNRFHFPNKGVLDRLKKEGVKILRTDLDGQLEVATDGERILYKTFSGLFGELTREPIPSSSSANLRGVFGSWW